MKAVSYAQYGDESVLQFGEVPDPKPAADRVIIEMRAAGVNPTDYKTREGMLDAMMDVEFPVIPGLDVAGVVTKRGFAVDEFSPGDEVIAYTWMDWIHHGTYAELVPAPVRCVVPKPRNLSWEEAAALPAAGLTAYQAVERSEALEDQVVLVHGAAGGVGSLACQLARLRGARVIGTARQQNHDYLAALGIEPIEYGDKLATQVRDLAPAGITRVIDCVGGGALQQSVELLAGTARPTEMVTVADAAGAIALGARVVGLLPNREQLQQLADLAASGTLKVHVQRSYALSDAAEAQRESKSGHVRGKLVVKLA